MQPRWVWLVKNPTKSFTMTTSPLSGTVSSLMEAAVIYAFSALTYQPSSLGYQP